MGAVNIDWFLWRPVIAGMIKAESLHEENVFSLNDIADLHEAIDIKLEMEEHGRRAKN